MKEKSEIKDLKEVKEVEGQNCEIAAFFDLDGTLTPLPSVERRFFRLLCNRSEIPLKNCFLWLKEMLRLLPRGVRATQANKMYLRGVQSFDESDLGNRGENSRESRIFHESGAENCGVPSARASGHQAGGQASAAPPKRARRNPRLPVPPFFVEGLERMAWHARRGHAIVLVSGTLEPLANAVAWELEAELAARGVTTKVRVCAARLEEIDGKFSGRIVGEEMFGEAKARAVRALAQQMRLDLSQCYAFGDSANDEAMLMFVGNPLVVNASRRLAQIARKRGWPVLRWSAERDLTQSSQRAQRTLRRSENKEKQTNESLLKQAERCT